MPAPPAPVIDPRSSGATRTPVLWLITDRKPGHRSQIDGLRQALERQAGARSYWLDALPAGRAVLGWLGGRFGPGAALPDPDLIIVAGQRTHWSGLAARRARGGRLVVLMRPSLPYAWFDLCVVPEHDAPPRRDNVLSTIGALNAIRPSAHHDAGQGLILVGGPSRHHGWHTAALVSQIEALVAAQPALRWTLSSSRRTPAETLAALERHFAGRIAIHPAQATPPGWVGERLAAAGQAWVTEDSVSMIYEALSSGAPTGVLAVPRTRPGRVAAGVDRLVRDGRVTRFDDWRASGRLQRPAEALQEAERIARLLVPIAAGRAAADV